MLWLSWFFTVWNVNFTHYWRMCLKSVKPKLTPLYFHSSHTWYAWLLYYKIQQFFLECVILHECYNNFAFPSHSSIHTAILNIHCFTLHFSAPHFYELSTLVGYSSSVSIRTRQIIRYRATWQKHEILLRAVTKSDGSPTSEKQAMMQE